MRILKQMLTIIAMLLCSVTASAYDFKVDGICYNITSSYSLTVEVTENSNSEYLGAIVIPSSVTYDGKKYSVTSIGSYAFEWCTRLTSISIPNTVTSIGNYAFSGCTGLTSVTIPNSVTSIGSSAFDGTAWYNNQPDGIVYAGKVLYKYKGNMPNGTSIEVEEGTLAIANSAFYGCSGLTSVTIPNSVTSIGNNAFYGCTGLTSVTIPNSVTSIGGGAFRDCSGLTSVTIPNSVTSIGDDAFKGCRGLMTVVNLSSLTISKGSTDNGNV